MADYTLYPSILPTGDDAKAAVADEIDIEAAETALAVDDCPFCDSYDGDYPANHAPKAHPNRWEALRDAQVAAVGASSREDVPPTSMTTADVGGDMDDTDGGEADGR